MTRGTPRFPEPFLPMASRGDIIDTAIELKSDADVVARLRQRMPESLAMLERIACGDVPRNAQTILAAIKVQLEFSQPRPKQVVEHQGAVGIAVVNPYAEESGEPQDAPPAPLMVAPAALPAPAPAPVAPVRRRAKAQKAP